MSRSYHVNRTHLRGYSKIAIDEMAKDPDSLLSQLSEKGSIKRAVRKTRKKNKQKKP